MSVDLGGQGGASAVDVPTGDASSSSPTAVGGLKDVAGTGGVGGGVGGRQDGGTSDAPDVAIGPTGGVVSTGGVAGVGGSGGTVTKPVVSSFTASPSLIGQGSSSTVSWTATGATTLTIDQGVGVVTGATSKIVAPAQTTTYTLTARDASCATATAPVVVTVAPTPSITSFSATPSIVEVGSTVSLSAVFVGRQGSIDPDMGNVTSGVPRTTPPLLRPTTFTLTVVNELGEKATAQVSVGVVGFVATGATSSARLQHAAALLANGKVLIAGGANTSSGAMLGSVELYDVGTGAFSPAGTMITPRQSHTATAIAIADRKVLLVGGTSNATAEPYYY
jgi:hypothetical protein